ncbi:MAG: hypothetical protein IJB94_01325 [Clostridia bacterium]|nr:hypothetical protein [Clostridia bacterium]
MDKKLVIGVLAGVAAGAAVTAATIAVVKVVKVISKEMKDDENGCSFTSPDGKNTVSLCYGASQSAHGLTRIKIAASTEGSEDTCKLTAFAKKGPYMFETEWTDNEHFKLLIGASSRKQCCDVSFTDGKITAVYSLCKVKRGE